VSQLDELVTAVAARVDDSTVAFEAGKLRINEHAQRRKAIFVRDSGTLKFSSAPGRQNFGIPVSGAGTTELQRFTRSENVMLVLRAEDEDALDALFDAVVNAIFDIGGPNVFENENQYEWAGKDSQSAGARIARNPEIVFMFRMRLQSHPKPQPYAVLDTVTATVTELDVSQIVSATVFDQFSEASAWLRLQASTQSAGKWTSVKDVLNVNPAVQADLDRQPAVGSSLNGLPTMVFDGTDVLPWPIAASNYSTDKLGYIFWFKPASVSGAQMLIQVPINGANISFAASGAALQSSIYMTPGATGRSATSVGFSLLPDVWHCIYWRYDSSLGGDANIAYYVDGALLSMSYANLGAGQALGVLPAASGSMLLGAASNSDTPSSPIKAGGQIGPNSLVLNQNMSPDAIAAYMAFEAPT